MKGVFRLRTDAHVFHVGPRKGLKCCEMRRVRGR